MQIKKKLLDIVREKIRVKHYSIKTEQSYVGWVKQYIFFHNKKHPIDMGKREIEEFLTYLAVERKVSPSTQNQAFSALLFLYTQVLGIDLKDTNIQALRAQVDYVAQVHKKDFEDGSGSVYMPYALEKNIQKQNLKQNGSFFFL